MVVERELSSKNREIEASGKKVKESETILKSLSEFRELVKNIVQDEELTCPKQAIHAYLINSGKGLDVLKQELFADFQGEERISIKEFVKILQKPPLKLKVNDAEDLARFLIESRDQPTVSYNKYADKLTIEIRLKLDSLLNLDFPKDLSARVPAIRQSALSVL